MPLPRSDSEIHETSRDVTKNEIRKVAVATVTGVHLDRQTVDVQLCTNNPVWDEIGNVFTEAAPSISDVPYGICRGGGMMVSIPIAVGDSVLLLFNDLSADVWRAGDGSAQDPGWVGKHTMDSPFAIPMFAPDAKFFSDPSAGSAAGKIVIGKDGSAAQIRISATDIELGNNATKALALAPQIDALITVLTATYAPSGTETGFAAFLAALATWAGTYSGTTASAVAKSQ